MTARLSSGITRRNFILDSAALVASSGLSAAALSIPSPDGAQLRAAPRAEVLAEPAAMSFALSDVRLLDGPFRISRDAEARYLMSLEADRLLAPYRIEAGLEPRAEPYPGWETDYLPGVALAFYLSGISNLSVSVESWESDQFNRRLDYMLDDLEEAQKVTGGYLLGTRNGRAIFARIEKEGKFDGFAPWGGGCAEPYYALEKIFSGLRDAYRVAGRPKALQIEVLLGDWLAGHMAHLSDAQLTDLMTVEYGGMNWVLSDLYADTGDTRYLAMSRRWQDRAVFDGPAAGKDDLAGKHANTQFPKFCGLAARYPYSGDASDLKTARSFWQSVVQHHSYATGGNSEHEHFDAPDSLSRHLSQFTEENCNEYNMLRLTQLLSHIEPRGEYAEYMERTLYNHALSAQDVRDGRVCYFLPLKAGASRAPESLYDDFTCCVCSGFDSYTRNSGYIYSHNAQSLFVNLFIASELNWKEKGLVLRQETKMPDEGTSKLRMTLRKPLRFSLHLRYPSWAQEGIAVEVNGARQKIDASPGEFFVLDREWSDGDTVLFKAPLTLRSEGLADDQDRVAVFAGPILLAGNLGSIANPALDDPGFIPLLVPNNKPVSQWLKATDEPLTFITAVAQPREVEVQPFFRLRDSSYAVYWDRVTPAGWDAHVSKLKEFHIQMQQLEERTLDRVAFGDAASESAHHLQVQGASTTGRGMRGLDMHLLWRAGESLAFEVKLADDEAATIWCRYFSQRYRAGDGPDIQVEGVSTSSEKLPASLVARELSGEVVEYAVPARVAKGRNVARVVVRSTPPDLRLTDFRVLRAMKS